MEIEKKPQSSLPHYPNLQKKQEKDNSNNLKNQLIRIISDFDSVELIALLTAKSLATNMVIEESDKNLYNETPALQFFIDLCLVYPNSRNQKPSISEINKIHQILSDYFDTTRQLFSYDEELIEGAEFSFLARLQSATSEINKEKYPFQIKEHVREIYFKLDSEFENKFGFSVSDAWHFGILIHKNAQERVREAISKKYGVIQKPESKNENQIIDKLTMTIAETHFSIFNIAEFCKKEGISDEKFGNYLKYYSCKFGEGKIPENVYSKFLIDYNPIIIMGARIFCPLLDFSFWNTPLIIEKLLETDKKNQTFLWQKLKNSKTRYMEEKIVSVLSKIFPRNSIYKNLYYEFEGRPETDIIVDYDNKILVIEAKSKVFSDKAFQGKVIRIKSDLKKILEDAYDQGMRVRKFLRSNSTAHFENENGKRILTIQNIPLKRIFIITVTLEPLGNFSTLLGSLQPLGLFLDGDYPWSVYLYDLEIISKIIKNPSIFLHYVEQRIEAQKEQTFRFMEEIQLLSWYLNFANLHPLGVDPKNKSISIVSGSSAYEKFDNYFHSKGPMPKLNIDVKILRMIKSLEKKHEFGYTDDVSDILNSINSNLLNISERVKDET